MRWKDQKREGYKVDDGSRWSARSYWCPSGFAAWPSEIKLLEPTIEKIAVLRKSRGRPRQNPVRIIADKGYDSDPLGERLLKGGIELICP